MDKVIEFIKKNQLVLVIALIAVLAFWFFILPNLERSDEEDDTVESFDPDLQKFIDKNVYLYTTAKDEDGKDVKKYIAVSPANNCFNLRGLNDNAKLKECKHNVAILQDLPNEFATFKLLKTGDERRDEFMLKSILAEKYPTEPYLDQGLFYRGMSSKLCFDTIGGNEFIKFGLEKTNTGYFIKFMRPVPKDTEGKNEFAYLAKCRDVDDLCLQGSVKYDRLCLTKIPADYLMVNFEIAPETTSEDEEDEGFRSFNETEGFEPSLGSLGDLYSLGSSEGSMDSRASRQYMVNGAMENFASGSSVEGCAAWKN